MQELAQASASALEDTRAASAQALERVQGELGTLRAGQSQQASQVEELGRSLQHTRQESTRQSVAVDLQRRTEQATVKAEMDKKLSKQADYMNDVVKQLQDELQHLGQLEKQQNEELSRLREEVKKEKEERKALQDYVDNVWATMDMEGVQETPRPSTVTWNPKTDDLGIPVLPQPPAAPTMPVVQHQDFMKQPAPPAMDYSAPIADIKPDPFYPPVGQQTTSFAFPYVPPPMPTAQPLPG